MAHRVPSAEARKEFADLIDRSARGERIKITRYRNTLAAIVSKKDLAKLEDCEEGEQARGHPEASVSHNAKESSDAALPSASAKTRRRSR